MKANFPSKVSGFLLPYLPLAVSALSLDLSFGLWLSELLLYFQFPLQHLLLRAQVCEVLLLACLGRPPSSPPGVHSEHLLRACTLLAQHHDQQTLASWGCGLAGQNSTVDAWQDRTARLCVATTATIA